MLLLFVCLPVCVCVSVSVCVCVCVSVKHVTANRTGQDKTNVCILNNMQYVQHALVQCYYKSKEVNMKTCYRPCASSVQHTYTWAAHNTNVLNNTILNANASQLNS